MDGQNVRAPALALPNLKMHPSAVICKGAIIEGDVTVGPGTVIHPMAVIRATKGPIVIGENNNIEERSLIENVEEDRVMMIGDENNFEVDAVVHAHSIGNKNHIQAKSEVGPGVRLGNGCCVGVNCQLLDQGQIPDRIVIWGANNNRRIAATDPDPIVDVIEVYRKILPSYHHIQKAVAGAS